ncbi:transcription factor AflR [Aspergillus ustus]|uniref:Transcription factor AflR n=1 Tax=Aspergillus ustus TaxID=40382 RepID=A0A0C1C3L8_ASPUT|nr:transcription factor AflR [Aspergillus ustus]
MEQPSTVNQQQQQHATPRPTPVGATQGGAQPPKQGTRKLRESCISCSRSKVKCDKEKPTCGRCVRRGLPCEYMVSRRTGRTRVIGVEKPPAASTAPSTAASQPPTDPPVPLAAPSNGTVATNSNPTPIPCGGADNRSSSNHPLPAATPHTPAITTRQSPKSSHLHSPHHDADLWTSILSPNASNSTDLSSLLSVNTDIGQLFASLSPSHLNDPDSIGADLAFHESGMLSVADPTANSLMQGIEHSDSLLTTISNPKSPPCCLAICLEILMRLFPNAQVGCERPGSQDGPSKLCTIESVIEDNKQILDTVQTVLECRCADDEYVATLVSLIVFKVMGWYVAVARDRSADPARDECFGSMSTESSALHSRRPSVSSFEEQVLHLPTVVGSYCVDGHHQSRMAAQLVLSELYRVQRLVTLVGRRLEMIRHRSLGHDSSGSTSSASSSVPDSSAAPLLLAGTPTPPLSSSTLAHLEEDLRKRLRAVSSETIDILRRA